MGLFDNRTNSEGKTTVPVWFMRQAGRYHSHYQNIKKHSDFMSMCKTPQLACDVTMGPIEEFNFDAAILFSDLLFPLEQLGMGLVYNPGPQLGFTLDTIADLKKLTTVKPSREFYQFQGDACTKLKQTLPEDKTLLGFVGAPFTLYTYAVEGGHSGNLTASKKGLTDGRWQGFNEILFENLLDEMRIQAKGGADAMCLFDTAVGELTLDDFKAHSLPWLRKVVAAFKKEFPDKKVIYYSKLTHIDYLKAIECSDIDVLGVDWRVNMITALRELGHDYMLQGNLDPSYLHLPWNELEQKWKSLWEKILASEVSPDRWICGLGHGVLQQTPEINVKKSVEYIHRNFRY